MARQGKTPPRSRLGIGSPQGGALISAPFAFSCKISEAADRLGASTAMAIPEFVLQSFLDQILGFFAEKGRGLVRDGLTKRKIKEAIKNASTRFENEYPNRELAKALCSNTKFYDLESVRMSIRFILEHPFDPAPKVQIESQFKSVLPKSDHNDIDIAACFYVERLQEELMTIEKLQMTLSLIYGKRTAEATERAASGVEELVAKQTVSQYEIDKAREKYLQYLIGNNKYIDPRGIMQTRRSVALKLDEVYVTLSAEHEVVQNWFDTADISPGDNWIEKLEKAIDKGEDHSDVETARQHTEVVDLAYAVRKNPRLIILGEPGAGKTTLVRFLALQFASHFTSDGSVRDRDGNDYGAPRLPIFLRIANFADAFSRNRSLTLRDYLLEHCDGGEVEKSLLKELLAITLQRGNALILLDGLDEIVDVGDRSEIARRIESFVVSYPSNCFVVTSRIAGYKESPLGGTFGNSLFTLREMERPQIEKFLQRWCPAAERSQTPDLSDVEIEKRAKAEIDGILIAVDENLGVRRLSSNPLMLTILVLIHRAGARLPSRRVELYELAIKTLLEDWELARGIPEKKIVKESEALRLLGPLAYWMHENKPHGLASENEVKERLAKVLSLSRNLLTDSEEVETAIEDFLKRVREHSGILVERAPKQYGFMHLTFEEYFAARDMILKRANAVRRIYTHRHDSRWEEPILLAIAFVGTDYPDDAMRLISGAILGEGEDAMSEGFSPSLYEDVLHRDILLALRACGICGELHSEFSKGILDKVMNIYFQECVDNVYLRDPIYFSLGSLRGGELASDILSHILDKMKDDNGDVRWLAIWMLRSFGVVNEGVKNALQNALADKDRGVQMEAIDSMANLGINNQEIISRVLEMLNHGSGNICISALHYYRQLRITSDTVLDGILARLNDNLPNVRQLAADVLRELGVSNDRIKAGLVDALNDSDGDVCGEAAYALVSLGMIEKEKMENDLFAMIDNEDEDGRIRAIMALRTYDHEDARVIKGILPLLIENNEKVRDLALNAWGFMGDGETTVEFWISLLNDNNKDIRVQAIRALAYIKPANKDVVALLTDMLNKDDLYVHATVVFALIKLGYINSVLKLELLAMLRNEDADVREIAMHAIVELGDRDSIGVVALLDALKDMDGDKRRMAVYRIGEKGLVNEEVVNNLLNTLQDNDTVVRQYTMEAFGKLGRKLVLHLSREKYTQVHRALYSSLRDPRNLQETYSLYSVAWRALWNVFALV